MAEFKMRYRQIIGDKTILLRLRNDQDKNRSRRRAKNPWNLKVSNLEAWNSIVRAWGYVKPVKPESIRNCFHYVPVLFDRQKDLLSEYTGATETEAIDPCVHEAVLPPRELSDSIEENQEEGSNIENQDEESSIENQDEEPNIEGSLKMPF
ncbi:hypothetical protein BGX31_004062, partial [Mortierella sp. GBA43]